MVSGVIRETSHGLYQLKEKSLKIGPFRMQLAAIALSLVLTACYPQTKQLVKANTKPQTYDFQCTKGGLITIDVSRAESVTKFGIHREYLIIMPEGSVATHFVENGETCGVRVTPNG